MPKSEFKETRILTLGYDRYVVPNDLTLEEQRLLFSTLHRLRKCDYLGEITGDSFKFDYEVKMEFIEPEEPAPIEINVDNIDLGDLEKNL